MLQFVHFNSEWAGSCLHSFGYGNKGTNGLGHSSATVDGHEESILNRPIHEFRHSHVPLKIKKINTLKTAQHNKLGCIRKIKELNLWPASHTSAHEVLYTTLSVCPNYVMKNYTSHERRFFY
jgi:hypothetical protein